MVKVTTTAFTDEELAAALGCHSGLSVVNPDVVEGEFVFHAAYEGAEILDSFRIRITKTNPNSKCIPALYEIGGRTEAIAEKWSIRDLRDLHRNPQGNACVCAKTEEPDRFPAGSDLLYFIDHLGRDYLFGLAFFDRHGRWPWGERSHGVLGILESLADTRASLSVGKVEEALVALSQDGNWRDYSQLLRRPSGDRACPCGSQKRFRICHPEAWQGLLKLGEEIDASGKTRRGAFDRARSLGLCANR